MNTVTKEDIDAPFFSFHEELAELERQLYGHVRDAIDFERISILEQHTQSLLIRNHKVPSEIAMDLAAQVIEQALQRAALDSVRYFEVNGPPPGITEAERKAVAFEPGCPFCEWEASNPNVLEHIDDGSCPCCNELAKEWRAEHAEVLAKAGLARPSGASAIAGAIEIAKRDHARRAKPS